MKKKLLMLIVCLLATSLLLQGLPQQVSATVGPTSGGMVTFALRALREHWGYVYGTYGHVVTQATVDGKRYQYPDVFAEIMSDGRTAYEHACEWIGGRAVDCAGLYKAYLWWDNAQDKPIYSSGTDRSANSIYASATVKGPISTIPNIHGLLVWRDGHMGVYIGNGEVIEARGVEYGVVKTRVGDRNWTAWLKAPNLTYPGTGWLPIDGKQYYYRDGLYVTGPQVIEGRKYMFGADGARLIGFQTIGGKLTYITEDGSVPTGWQTIEGNRYFFDGSGNILTGWQTIEGRRYFFDSKGALLSGWQQLSDQIYYLGANGSPASGSPVTGPVDIAGRSYSFDSEGRLQTGWQVDGSSRGYRSLAGQLLTGLQTVGDQVYLFDSQGIAQTGWQTVAGKSYYFDPATGSRLTGGLQTIAGQTYLLQADASRPQQRGPVYVNGKVYLSDAAGLALTGDQTATAVKDGHPAAPQLGLKLDTTTAQLLPASQTTYSLPASLTLTAATAMPAQSLAVTGSAPVGAEWLTLDPAVATVSQDGRVQSVAIGRTLIVLRGADQSYAACVVTVLPAAGSLTLASAALTAEPGMAVASPVQGLPASLLDAYTFISAAPTAVTVLANGSQLVRQITATQVKLMQGDATLLTWTVTGRKPLIGISLSRSSLQLAIGSRLDKLVSLVPATGTSAALSFSSSNATVGIIDSTGTARALTAGSTTLTAKAGDFTANCSLTVTGKLPTLNYGMENDSVRTLQETLNALGYLAGPADGSFGPRTEFAVTALQKRMNLPLSGEANHDLQVLLLGGQATRATVLQNAGVLTPGDSGEQVFVFQNRLLELNYLKAAPGGNFGPITTQAVKALQTLNSLPATGSVGTTELALVYDPAIIAGQSTLSLGESGYEVLLLQQRLATLYYYSGPLDSQFSASVDTAVRSFQTVARLTVDGEAGFTTQSRLYAANAPVNPTPPAPAAPTPVPTQPTPVPTPAPAPAPQPVYAAPVLSSSLKLGSRGDAVRVVQLRLNQLGFNCGVADGIFGNMTNTAVRAFQTRAGLTVDGIVGSRTIARLFDQGAVSTTPTTPAPTPAPAPAPTPAPTGTLTQPALPAPLKVGSRGEAVRQVQLRLNQLSYNCGVADGIFGSRTGTAVRSFQSRARLTVDGIVGRMTLNALYATTAPHA